MSSNSLLSVITNHSHIACLPIPLMSLSQTLAVVGLFATGIILMLAVWAVIAAESLSLKLTLIAATTGTIAGDGIHSWLGRHYHEQLRK